MEYLLFTYPNCLKCEAVKKALETAKLKGDEYNLVTKEGKKIIREYLKVIKRDAQGGIVLPTLILQEEGETVAVLNSQEELSGWLQSRA